MLALSASGFSCSRSRTGDTNCDFGSIERVCVRQEKEAAHLKPPQATNVIAALKADWLQTLVQAGLDGGQTGATSPNHCYTTRHSSTV